MKNEGTRILEELVEDIKNMSSEEFEKFCKESEILNDIVLCDVYHQHYTSLQKELNNDLS